MITISIVSHGHGAMIERVVAQALGFATTSAVVLTLNIPEQLTLPQSDRLVILRNDAPKGFGANHNAAFRHRASDFFCVLNPDVVFGDDPFPGLLKTLDRAGAAVVAPLVVTSEGSIEDSIRRFPTIASLAAKFLGSSDGRYEIPADKSDMMPDWTAGMFMLFRSPDFAAVGGFDEAFFLYYEDVDICARLWKSGRKVSACPSEKVVHDAQRASHGSWRFRRWHFQSLVRYLLRYALRHPRQP
jgi:GT2 family glycosyltransferase